MSSMWDGPQSDLSAGHEQLLKCSAKDPGPSSLTLYTKIPAEIRLCHVNVLDFHIYIVDLTVRLLSAFEFASGSEKGGGVTGE
jgi:hypothetical protein